MELIREYITSDQLLCRRWKFVKFTGLEKQSSGLNVTAKKLGIQSKKKEILEVKN